MWFDSQRPADGFYETLLYNSSKVSLGGELSRTHNTRGKPLFKHYRWQELGKSTQTAGGRKEPL